MKALKLCLVLLWFALFVWAGVAAAMKLWGAALLLLLSGMLLQRVLRIVFFSRCVDPPAGPGWSSIRKMEIPQSEYVAQPAVVATPKQPINKKNENSGFSSYYGNDFGSDPSLN